MKTTEINKLKIGDWVLSGKFGVDKMKGVFRVARVSGIRFNNFEEIDLNKGNIEIIGEGRINDGDGIISVLNRKEIKALNILRTKLKTLKGLEDNFNQLK